MNNKIKIGIVSLSLIGIVCLLKENFITSERSSVVINEVRCWNADVKRDGYYGSDYIELYNQSDETISLDGWGLSDDKEQLAKGALSGVVIEPKSHAVIYADGKGESGDSVGFKISSEGETVFLSDEKGNLVDHIYVPKQEFGTVYARVYDGAEQWSVMESTTGYRNEDGKTVPEKSLEEPRFSKPSGFYESAFYLSIHASEGETIYYTLDGSTPTENSNIYTKSLWIENKSAEANQFRSVKNVVKDWKQYDPDETPADKAVVIRAMAMDSEGRVSEVVTHTYFVGLDAYEPKNVISLVADAEDLFGENGIYVTGKEYDEAYLSGKSTEEILPNFMKHGRAWEIQGTMELFSQGALLTNETVGMRIQGNSSREKVPKRFSIYARKEYSGSEYFQGFFIEDHPVHAFMLNGSNASGLFPNLVKDRSFAVQGTQKYEVFLNGEYWYSVYALEKYNRYYLEEHYGVDPENVIIVKDYSCAEGNEEDYNEYLQLLEYAETKDLSVKENYEQLKEMMDIQSYIDYLCANIYLCNMDLSETKNNMLWKTVKKENNAYGDGRWRWMLYDIDCMAWLNVEHYHVSEKAEVNSFTQTMRFTGKSVTEWKLYSALKENKEFCETFVQTFMDMANVNFSMENIERIFKTYGQKADVYGDFFEKRFSYIVPYMAEQFELKGTLENVTLKNSDPEAGYILLNTTKPDLSGKSWTGKYYTDYPIHVTAVPEEGYRFVGWRGSVNGDSSALEAVVEEHGIVLEAVFEKIR